jgi:hypothetical protein
MSGQQTTDPIVDAQHDETGRMWRGPLSRLPSRFSVVPVAELQALRAENARLREALVPLKLIADRYDDDGLDEARPSWGGCVPDEILMVQGRGGKAFLTLQQCFDARAALEVKP